MRQLIVLVGMFGLLAAGCASDEPEQPPSDRPPTSNAALGGIDNLRYAVATGDAAAVAGGVLGAQAYTLTIPTPRLVPLPDEFPRPRHDELGFTGSASCTRGSCTFSSYGDDYNGVSFRLNGTISASGDRLTFDLTLDLTSPEGSLRWEMAADVTITATRLDGWMRSHGTANDADGTTASWDFDLDYNGVTLDGGGCPIGGSVAISYTFTSTDSGPDSGVVTFTYGPTCGDLGWSST